MRAEVLWGLNGLHDLLVLADGRIFDKASGNEVCSRPRKDGYWTFKHKGKTLYVHRVVCHAFHGPPPTPDAEADHEDRSRSNNREDNLSWLSPEANKARRHYPNRRTRPPRTEPTHPELKRLHGEPQ